MSPMPSTAVSTKMTARSAMRVFVMRLPPMA